MTNVLEDGSAVGILVILVLSVNLVSGYARQLSLGQAAFAGIGAYASALLAVRLQMSFWLACPLSVLLTAGVGAALGAPVLWGVRFYVPVMTLTLNALVFHLLRLGRLIGEPVGFGRIPPPQLFDRALSAQAYLMLVVGAVICCLAVDWRFRRSARGRVLFETPEDGVEAWCRAEFAALVISAAMAGLAGSLFAHFAAFISPFDFDLETSLFVLAVAAFGGLGFLPGVLVSAVGLGFVVEWYRDLLPYRFMFSGVVFLLASLGWPWLGRRRLQPGQAPRQDACTK